MPPVPFSARPAATATSTGCRSAWVHESSARIGKRQLCDGVPECIRAVRLQLRAGAKVIKVCASGGVLSELDDPIH